MVHKDYMIGLREKIDSMGYQDSSTTLQDAKVYILDYLLSNMRVKGGYRIVHQVNVFILVYGSSETKSRFLTSTKIHTFLPNFSLVPRLQQL